MIEACNQYLDTVTVLNLPSIIFKSNETEGTWEDLNFDRAMKQFRDGSFYPGECMHYGIYTQNSKIDMEELFSQIAAWKEKIGC